MLQGGCGSHGDCHVVAVLALGGAGATGILSHSHGVIFRSCVAHVHPLPAVLMIGLLGVVALLDRHS